MRFTDHNLWEEETVRSKAMAAVIRLVPLDDRGGKIIDELEEKAEERPTEVQSDGGRLYHLDAEDVGVDAFDAILDGIDSDWQGHVTRTSSIIS